jgi:hypothetical protein
MKRYLVLLIAFLIVFALVGCNVAPNVPGVTPNPTYSYYYNSVQGGAYGPPANGNNRISVDGS